MRSQGLPVRLIVIAGLGILALVVGAAMFVIGMRGAAQQTTIVNATQAECNSICALLSVAASNYQDCDLLKATPKASEYSLNCIGYGACRVSLSSSADCSIP